MREDLVIDYLERADEALARLLNNCLNIELNEDVILLDFELIKSYIRKAELFIKK